MSIENENLEKWWVTAQEEIIVDIVTNLNLSSHCSSLWNNSGINPCTQARELKIKACAPLLMQIPVIFQLLPESWVVPPFTFHFQLPSSIATTFLKVHQTQSWGH